jgi:hypothetical protein
VFGRQAYEGLIERFKYGVYRMVCVKYKNFFARQELALSRCFIFHVDCFNVLRAHGHRMSKPGLWRLGSAMNPMWLLQPLKDQLFRERYQGEALLRLNSDDFCDARQDLDLLFRLPLELQHLIASRTYPCMYSSLAAALTTTGSLLKKVRDPLPMPLELFLGSPKLKFAGMLYVKPIASNYDQPNIRNPRKPRVVDYPSVRYLDPQLGTGHPCTRTTRTSSVLYFLIRYLDPKVQ